MYSTDKCAILCGIYLYVDWQTWWMVLVFVLLAVEYCKAQIIYLWVAGFYPSSQPWIYFMSVYLGTDLIDINANTANGFCWCIVMTLFPSTIYLFDMQIIFIIPPASTKLKGEYTGFTLSVSLSVRLWTELCPLCIFNNTCQTHLIFAHLIKTLQNVCRV